MVIWQSPSSKEIKAIVSTNGIPNRKILLETSGPGFVVSPFVNTDGEQTLFLSADLFYSSYENEFKSLTNNASIVETFKNYPPHKLDAFEPNHKEYLNLDEVDDEANFISLVKKGMTFLADEGIKKIVLSRTKIKGIPPNFDVIEAFLKLCDRSNAFNSLVLLPNQGIWIGASPEILIKIEDNIFHTVALAGTQLLSNKKDVKRAVWTHKEIEEQALVSRYIIDCFKKIRLREYEDIGPKTIVAGNLLHLRTDFTVDLGAINYPDLGSTMLALLHPTSAVCGMPKHEALAFILANEGYERELFSGYLGPVNIQKRSEVYVNLRCAKISNNKVQLFAGAGITLESEPHKEYYETEHKMSNIGVLFE